MLCDHLEGWDMEGGRETQEGGDMGYIYTYSTPLKMLKKNTKNKKQINQ